MKPAAVDERARAKKVFWVILSCAAVIRVIGIFGQGFPECFYPDETNAIQRALRFGAERTADPNWFNKPALAYYVWFCAYGGLYAGGRVLGYFATPEQFGAWAFSRAGPFLVLGRMVSTLFGLGTVWMTYLLGKAIRGRTTGLVAALALALTYPHVVTGQWVKEDVPAGFFHTAATVLLVSAMRRSRVKDTLWSGFVGGLGMATKYYSVGLFIPAAFAHLFPARTAARPVPVRGLLLASFFALFVAGFFVGAPYNFLRPDFWIEQVRPGIDRVFRILGIGFSFGAIGVPQAQRYSFVDSGAFSFLDVSHALVETLYMPEGLGLGFFVLAVGGMILGIARRGRVDCFLLVAVLGQAIFIALANRQFSEQRHLVVLYPLLAVWIADSATFIASRAARIAPRVPAGALAGAVVLAALAVPGVPRAGDGAGPGAGPSTARMLGERCLTPISGDTRLLALRWIEQNVTPGSTILNDHEVLPLRANEARAEWAMDRLRKSGARSADVWTYVRRWQFRKAAAEDHFRPTYDVLVVEAPWGAETREDLERHRREAYDCTWPLEMEAEPQSVSPVRRYTDVPLEAKAALESRPSDDAAIAKVWPAAKWLLSARPVEWLVSSEETYNNYDNPKHPEKRVHFPVRAAFYDDLKAHYACRQWSAGRRAGMTGPTIRLYDLRARVSGSPQVIEMLGGER